MCCSLFERGDEKSVTAKSKRQEGMGAQVSGKHAVMVWRGPHKGQEGGPLGNLWITRANAAWLIKNGSEQV